MARSYGLGFACFALLVAAASATQFRVGGQRGWSVPDTNVEPYNAWSGRMRFQIGDQLLFVYPKETDSVLLVEPSAYNSCNASSYVQKFDDGSTVFTFNSSGPSFFISGNEANCRANEKLIVVVLADRSGRTPPAVAPAPSMPPTSAPMPSPSSSPPSAAPMPSPAATPSSAPSPTASAPALQFMPSLRVLDLSYTSISELPSGISALVELQYLDLYNTNIKSLPRELGALVTLRFLLLSNMPLEMIPSGVMGSLTMLQVLYMDLSYGDWKVGASGNGVDFQELESLRRLKALDITIQSLEALERLSRSYRLAGSTRNLLIKTCASLTKIELPSSNLWKNMTGLKRVWILNCSNLVEVIIGGSKETDRSNALPNVFVPRWGELVDDEQPILPNQHDVILQGLQKVKIIYKGGCVQNLASLFIWYCHGLEELITLSDEGQETAENSGEQAAGMCKVITPFPNLKGLHLRGLANFSTLSSSTCMLRFPSLENLNIVECPSLKKLKLSAAELNAIQCTRECWDGLEWDDEEVKACFEPLFQPMH